MRLVIAGCVSLLLVLASYDGFAQITCVNPVRDCADVCGDVDGSAAVAIGDALVAAQFTVGLRDCTTVPRFHMCDVGPTVPDGLCNIGDALRMAQCSVGLISCNFSCVNRPPAGCGCGNGVCDVGFETDAACPSECGCIAAPEPGICSATDTAAPAGCFCDPGCTDLADCCGDSCSVCGNGCPTCGDDVCDQAGGESDVNCALDCGCAASAVPSPCDSGVAPGGCSCSATCAATGDCCADACAFCGSACTACGNGICEAGEDAATCAADCGCAAAGACGSVAPDFCGCDADCLTFSDCCPDACAVCGVCP